MQRLNKIAKKTKQRAVKDKQIDVLNTHTLWVEMNEWQ
jgi:hypothetical protein